MSILPRPPVPTDEHGDPPAVAFWRDKLKESRAGAWMKGHRSLAAALAGLLVLLKSWRWLAFDLWRVLAHPDRSASWVADHLVLLAVLSTGLFLVTFLVTRFGLDELFRDADEDSLDGVARGERRLQQARHDAATMRR